ncbi:unnamed protein product [Somion occarium]|uniref:DUF6533 domain-containing protein n=1 Tax=Somion occarium TaxID=3059160 RepID=A0ABP1E5A3_9APHY
MSDADQPDFDPEIVAAEVEDVRRIGSVLIASSVLVAFDIVLTFSREVECIWKRKWNAVTLLYIVNRYGALFDLMVGAIFTLYVAKTVASCKAIDYSTFFFDILVLSGIAAFTCLRVWATCDRKWLPLIVVFLLSFFVPAANIYAFSTPAQWIVVPSGPVAGCFDITPPLPVLSMLPFIVRGIAIASDALVLLLTLLKTLQLVKEGRRLQVKTKLSSLLIRNGVVQFGALLALNVLTIILDVLSIATDQTSASEFVYLNNAVASILISRFLLDLRLVYLSDGRGTESDQPEMSSVHFATAVLGNIGAPVEYTSWLSGSDHDRESEGGNSIVYTNDPLATALSDTVETMELASPTNPQVPVCDT